MTDCIFCKILSGAIPSTKVYEDESVYAFRDINPQADTHILVIPREHISGADAITESNSAAVARCFEAIPKIAAQEGVDSFRVITNNGVGAGQSVFHLHFHILSGAGLSEKLL
ncbi:MAG: histidine triad nucleotide-binding protein [Oscillospiraceae bacterium]|jgi:histidine triad (HIT) family protein|nr:histidine triad nucleotide-binding protein [Oscillospiraceae bacterium]